MDEQGTAGKFQCRQCTHARPVMHGQKVYTVKLSNRFKTNKWIGLAGQVEEADL